MYVTLATLFRQFEFKFESFETDRSDVEPAHEFFVPVLKLDSKGVRVLVRGLPS
jgi:hypothetical protein